MFTRSCIVPFILLLTINMASAQETIMDIDGNVYETAIIGDQVWMLENLKTTTLNDGQAIVEFVPDGGGDDLWFQSGSTSPMFVWPDTSDANNVYEFELPIDFYGAFYSYGAIASGKLAPEGWRVASEKDFANLESFIVSDGITNTASALRGVSDWPFMGPGMDAYGYRALPGGFVTSNGFITFTQLIARWATTDTDTVNGFERIRVVSIFQGINITFGASDLRFGHSVRCVKDIEEIIPGDVNRDGEINLLDIDPFIELLSNGMYAAEADINEDGIVNLLDVDPFILILSG